MATPSNFDYRKDELLIFVGHSSDAIVEAKSVCELERELQRELDRLIGVMNDRPRFTKIHFWEWNSDAKPQVGGQEKVINPYLQRASVAIFIFKTRIGPVTWDEIDQCRSREPDCIPIIAVFPDEPPDRSSLKDQVNVENWSDLLRKKKQLTEDWPQSESRSVLPVEDYRDCEHLKNIILDQVKRILGDLLKPTGRTEPTANLASHDFQALTTPFIEQVTNVASYDIRTLSNYRKSLRDEARVQFPQALSDTDFLTKAGYLRNGGLTRAGVLLFTLTPETEFPTAKVRCVIYHGSAKRAARNRREITGPVHQQIEQVYDFISSSVEKIELPKRGSLEASTIYRYPMNCIREVVANALCHRNYEDAQRMTYFRIFSDRIEVSNPGTWGIKSLGQAKIALGELGGESVPPNFRLAHGIASINIVEMEGSGIPTAVEDCETTGAPEPVVTERDGYVVVTVFPKDNWASEIKRITREPSERKSSERPAIFISYSHKDEEWKNRLLPHLKMLEQAGRISIWDDRSIDAGSAWYGEISSAISQAAVAICLISSDYLASDFCSKEELPYLLERRERDGMVLLPILIRPCLWKSVSWLKGIQMFPRDGKSIAKDYRDNEDEVFASVAERIFEVLS